MRPYGTAPRLFSKTGSGKRLGRGGNTGDNFPSGSANSPRLKPPIEPVADPCALGNLSFTTLFASCSLLASGERAFRMQISWDDVNRTERVGPHLVAKLGIDVFISQRAIENWKTDPNGCHHVVVISTTRGRIYALGTFGPCQ